MNTKKAIQTSFEMISYYLRVFSIGVFTLALTSCSSLHIPLLSETSSISTESPESFLKSDDRTEWIAIAGLNDFHGTLLPLKMKTKELNGKPSIDYTVGGAATLTSYVRVLQNEFGPRFLLLDAGDTYQGTLESNLNEGQATLAFYNALGVHASTIGNHEFDYGPDGIDGPIMDPDASEPFGSGVDLLGALKRLTGEAKFKYLNSNVYEKKTSQPYPFPNSSVDALFQVGQVKIGVIGGTTLDTPVSTRSIFLKDVYFAKLAPIIQKRSAALRAAGAHAVILVAHVGLQCARPVSFNHSLIRRKSDPQGDCSPNDEMTEILDDLPRGTLDAVIAGHSHQVVHHWVNGTPVVQAGARGNYLNVLYLKFDLSPHNNLSTNELPPKISSPKILPPKILPNETVIEGPIPICERAFKNQGDCNGERIPPKQGRGRLVTPVFHGKKITPDNEIKDLLRPYLNAAANAEDRAISTAPESIYHIRDKNSPLGFLIADAVREMAKTDFSLVNPGGIRANLNSGKVTYGDIYRILPFDNAISILRLKGSELKKLISVAQSGARGFFPVSGLKIRVIGLNHQVAATDRDRDGKLSPWEINRLIEIKTDQDLPIEENKIYTLATLDFLVTGGDDLGWVMRSIPKDRIHLDAGLGWMRDVVEASFSHKGKLVAPADIRIFQEAPPIMTRRSTRSKKQR